MHCHRNPCHRNPPQSRAQRDVIVFMLHAALKHQQRNDAARLLLAVHRPLWSRGQLT